MKCPVCKDYSLQSTELQMGLPAYQCPRCNGIWISSNEYLNWRKTQGDELPGKAFEGDIGPIWQTEKLKLCPNCSHILTRYRIMPGVKFYLDHCGHCQGVWCDAGEWDIIVSHNLHDKVNQFFTRPWQARIHEAETRNMLDKLYLEKFGPEDYSRIKEIWEWLTPHPHRAMLLAYLQADNPYKI